MVDEGFQALRFFLLIGVVIIVLGL
jgi:hypothetical protein